MKLKAKKLPPRLQFFIGSLILYITLFSMIRAVLNLNPFDLSTASAWLNLFGFPLLNALGLTFALRRLQLVVTDSVDMENIKSSTLKYLNSNGLKIKRHDENGIVLASGNRFNRLFGHWFGTETIHMRQTDNAFIIEGPYRHVDSVDSKLRFGKEFK